MQFFLIVYELLRSLSLYCVLLHQEPDILLKERSEITLREEARRCMVIVDRYQSPNQEFSETKLSLRRQLRRQWSPEKPI